MQLICFCFHGMDPLWLLSISFCSARVGAASLQAPWLWQFADGVLWEAFSIISCIRVDGGLGNFIPHFRAHATAFLCSNATNNRLSYFLTFLNFHIFCNKCVIKKLCNILSLPESSWDRFSLKCYRNNFCPNIARMTVDMANLMSFGSQVVLQRVTYVICMLDNCIFSVASIFYYFGRKSGVLFWSF